MTGTGWEDVPPALRRQSDTPWFKSVLTYDPAKVLPKIRQPLLVVHGDLDPMVPASEADRLGELASARKKAATEVVHIPDVGRSLAPSGSNDVSVKAIDTLVSWIKKL
jgi:fermentation-respiration switch protein FrsA (DUF1100 family)